MSELEDLVLVNEEAVRPLYEANDWAYHNYGHAKTVEIRSARLAGVYRLDAESTAILRVAALWHDAIYDPASKTNEDDSAKALMAEGPNPQEYWPLYTVAAGAVASTAHKEPPFSLIGAILCDVDLGSGLATENDEYFENSKKIKSEYVAAGFTDEDWLVGRLKFIDAMLGRPRIFYTSEYAHLEERARLNLVTEQTHLKQIGRS